MLFHSSDPDYNRTVDDFDSGKHLRHARAEAEKRGLDKMLVIDVDCHHYETDNFGPILQYIDDPNLRQIALNTFSYKGPAAMLMDQPGYQDMGGRVMRYQMRKGEKVEAPGLSREVAQTLR